MIGRGRIGRQQPLSTLVVFFEGVARGQEKDGFNQQESGIGPADLARGLDADSMANPGDGVNGGEKLWRLAGEKCSALPVGITRRSVAGSSLRGVCSLLRLCAGPA